MSVPETTDLLRPNELQEYFESIEKPFEETDTFEEREGRVGPFRGFLIVLFVFCLIPLVPYGLSLALSKFLGPRFFPIAGHNLSLTSFWFLWPVGFATSLIVLVLSFKLRTSEKDIRDRRLSAAQMRFAYCYATANEIQQYQKNRLTHHIQKAGKYFERLVKSMWRFTTPDVFLWLPENRPYHGIETELPGVTMVPGAQLRALSERLRWFRLEPKALGILSAISDMPAKFRDRIKDKKDLSIVRGALKCLAGYLYTEIPDIREFNEEKEKKSGKSSGKLPWVSSPI